MASSITMIKKLAVNTYPFSQTNVPIDIKARQILWWTRDKYGLPDRLPQSPITVFAKEEDITLIPMLAARLRIASIPLSKN